VTNVSALCAQTGPPRCANTVTGLGPIPLDTGEDHDKHYDRQSASGTLAGGDLPGHPAGELRAVLAGARQAVHSRRRPRRPLRPGHAPGLIAGPELIAVLHSLDAFTSATIVCDVPGGAS